MLIHNLVATGSISYNGVNISYVTGSQTSLDGLNQFSASVNTTTGSLNETTGSLNTATGSLFTASGSFSTRVTKIEGNYATTGSNVFLGAQTVCANITSTGTIIAQTLNVQQVTSSIVYSSGSNIFGCSTSDVQQMTGSLRVTGSGNHFIVGGNFGVGTSSPNTKFEIGEEASPILRITSTSGPYSQIQSNTVGTLQLMADEGNTGANTSMRFRIDGFEAMRFTSSGSACFACQTCTPGMDIMPSGIGVSTLGGIMRVVTTGTSTGIAVGQSNANRYTHFAANDIQVFNDDFFLTTRCAFPLSIGTCYTARLTFAATGEACFSCRVCAPQGIFINGAASLQAQFGQNNDATGTQTSAIDIISRNAANTAGFTFRIQNCATTCTTHLVYSGNTVMAFRCDGNVGIGMTSPQAPLHIIKALGNDVISIGETGTNTRFTIGQEASYTGNYINSRNIDLKIQAYCAGGSGGNIIFQTANDGTANVVERMRISSGGSVCIGSAAVSGEILRVTGCSCLDNYISVYSGTIQVFLDADKTFNQGIVGTQSGHALSLRTSGTNRLTISTAGVLDFPGSNSTATSASDTLSFGVSSTTYAWIQSWGGRPLRINEQGNNVNAYGTNGYGLVNTTASDVRIKKNITSIENALDKVNCLRGVYYEFDENNSMCMKVPSGKRRVGLIAQEVACVLPEALLESQDDSTPISLDYSGMIGLLTKAIQEQQCKINILESCLGIN